MQYFWYQNNINADDKCFFRITVLMKWTQTESVMMEIKHNVTVYNFVWIYWNELKQMFFIFLNTA